MGCNDQCTDRFVRNWRRSFKRFCPPLFRFLHGEQDECLFLKHALGFPVGALLGFALHYFVLSRLILPPPWGPLLTYAVVLSLAIGFSASVQIRCISLLVLPHFFGKHGRAYVMTFALTLLLTGPVMNLMFNAREISRSMACVGSVLINQTKVKLDLRTRPIRNVMFDMQEQGKSIDKKTKALKKEFQPMKFEVRNDGELVDLKQRTNMVDDATDSNQRRAGQIEQRYKVDQEKDENKKREKKYERKLDYRCEDIWSLGVINCREAFRAAEVDCRNKLPAIIRDVVCWPMKITVMCEFVRAVPALAGISCDSSQIVNEGFGEEFEVADEASEQFDKNFEVSMKYRVDIGVEELELSTMDDIRKAIDMDFQTRQDTLNFIMDFVKRVLAFVFVRVFLSASSYHRQFLTSITYDNHYVTSYFRHIDARRYKKKKRVLLPLKRLESTKYISTTQVNLLSKEKRKLLTGTVQTVLRVLMFGMIYFVDHLIYTVLFIIQSHSHIEYKQQGVHHVAMLVDGTGIIATLIRDLFRAFNTRHTIDNFTSNFECLPRPRKLNFEFFKRTMAVFLILWLLMLVQAYALRLRRVVASFFYPKREKCRVLYLYNDLLKRRKGFLRHMRKRVKALSRERALSLSIGILGYLRTRYPFLFSWFRCVGLGKRKCTICQESENDKMRKCNTANCHFIYCDECWHDVKGRCYACLPDAPHRDSTDASSDSGPDSDG